MTNVVRFKHQEPPSITHPNLTDPHIIDLAEKARAAIYDEKGLMTRATNKRIQSGIYLLALQTLIEEDRSRADGMTFWQFFEYVGFGISRKEAEKRIAIAKQDNPEEAAEAAAQRNREAQAKHRIKAETEAAPAYVSGKPTDDSENESEPDSDQWYVAWVRQNKTGGRPWGLRSYRRRRRTPATVLFQSRN
jgi:hypothetical protein